MASDNKSGNGIINRVPVANQYRPCGHVVEDENIRCHFCECYCKSKISGVVFEERYAYYHELLTDDAIADDDVYLEDLEIVASRKFPCVRHITTPELHQLMEDREYDEVDQWK